MTNARAIDIYEQIAEAYATRTETSPFNALYERPAMLQLIGDVSGMDVFDVGCGHGYYAEKLLASGASQVVGIDASTKMVELAQARLGGRARLHVADVAGPLDDIAPDASFDLVICPLILHYVADWTIPFASFHRLLRREGSVVLSIGHPMEDFGSSVTGNYFEQELLEETWPSFGVSMPTYRRSFTEIFGAIKRGGFAVDHLLEPIPAPELEQEDSALYKSLSTAPNFLCLRLHKRA